MQMRHTRFLILRETLLAQHSDRARISHVACAPRRTAVRTPWPHTKDSYLFIKILRGEQKLNKI